MDDESLYYHEQRNLLANLTALIDEAKDIVLKCKSKQCAPPELISLFDAQQDIIDQMLNWQNIQQTATGHLTRKNLYETLRLDSFLYRLATRLETQLCAKIIVKCRAMTLCTDYDKFGVVLENLIGNAVKYSKRQPVMIHVEKLANRIIELRVIDRGCNIAKEDLARIGEPGFRTEAAAQIAGGTGLGIYFSRRLLKQLGFSLHYTSSIAGTVAIVRI